MNLKIIVALNGRNINDFTVCIITEKTWQKIAYYRIN